MANYVVFADSCSDLTKEERASLGIGIFRMNIVMDGLEKPADLDWEAYTPEELYGWILGGKRIKTNQVPVQEYLTKAKPVLASGKDILYISCSSALSGSINVFEIAKGQLLEEFPDRKIIGVDSLSASGALGYMILDAAKMANEGKPIEEVAKYVEDHRNNYNQFCTVDTLKYFKDAGRVKGTAAFFGDIFGVKPIIISDCKGNNLVVDKVKGTKASLDALFQGIKGTIDFSHGKVVRMVHANCFERASLLKKRFEDELGCEVILNWMGPIIGATAGPGTIGVFCYGKEITRFEGDGK